MPYKFKLKRGRLYDDKWCFNILRDGNADVYEFVKDKISLEEFSELIYLFFDEFANQVIENKMGIELPCGIGYISIAGVRDIAYKVGESPKKLNKAVINQNYNTDGYLFKTFYKYTNNDNLVKSLVGNFENVWMYSFKTAKPFRLKLSNKIKVGKWKEFALFNDTREFLGTNSGRNLHKIKKNK